MSSSELVRMDDRSVCANCAAWRPKKDAPHAFGGCARGGTTTVHFGDTVFSFYTTDTQSCSMFTRATAVAEDKPAPAVRDTWRTR